MTDPNPDKQLPHKDINSELEAHFRINYTIVFCKDE